MPKKLLSYAAHFRSDFADAAGFGWTVGGTRFDWPTLIANKDKEIARLNRAYEGVLSRANVEIMRGRATLLDAHSVEVKGQRFTAKHILIATGGQPTRDKAPGAVEFGLVSDDLFFLPSLPKRVLIAGGGYIAVEFAGIFHGLGSAVTQIYRGELFLRGFDDEVRAFLRAEMEKKGVLLKFNTTIKAIEKTSGGYLCRFSDGSSAEYDAVVYAIGRQPNVAGLGLEKVGVQLTDKGAIKVNDFFQTSVPSIHAIGDVTDRLNLTPVALAEGMALVKTLFKGQPTKVDYENVPTAVFSHPTIGTVGLSETAARQRYGAVDIYKTSFTPMKHTLAGNPEKTFMKLVVAADSQRVVGAHMVGSDAPEILQGLAIALKAGATKADFDATIGIHPTAAEEFVTLRDKSN